MEKFDLSAAQSMRPRPPSTSCPAGTTMVAQLGRHLETTRRSSSSHALSTRTHSGVVTTSWCSLTLTLPLERHSQQILARRLKRSSVLLLQRFLGSASSKSTPSSTWTRSLRLDGLRVDTLGLRVLTTALRVLIAHMAVLFRRRIIRHACSLASKSL